MKGGPSSRVEFLKKTGYNIGKKEERSELPGRESIDEEWNCLRKIEVPEDGWQCQEATHVVRIREESPGAPL